ncbi:hypothetical protein F5Y08DRAFT_338248 [Xylaria arbuscula]|nr:hypothetical protein F5Y08DRAFT_338248 [Xylaria arbuscula]
MAEFSTALCNYNKSLLYVYPHLRARELPIEADTPGLIIDIFVKETPHAHDEYDGALRSGGYFRRVSIPRLVDSGTLLYQYFPGRTASDVRLSYVLGGRKDGGLFEKLLEIELVKAGDTLRAYRRSLCRLMRLYYPPKIQRFFYDRLLNDSRIRSHYGEGVALGGQLIPLDTLLSLRWIINGKTYPSLRHAYGESQDILNPRSAYMLSSPIAFGMGDAHNGNVMINESKTERGAADILFIDYEVAGLHPVMMDLAKPLYNDLAYEILYRKLIPNANGIDLRLKYDVNLEENTIEISFKPQVDALTQALFDIKFRYLLEPLCDHLQYIGVIPDNHVPVLSTALFLCATLGISFANNEEAFVANFAAGQILRGAQTWRELLSGLEELGFTH